MFCLLYIGAYTTQDAQLLLQRLGIGALDEIYQGFVGHQPDDEEMAAAAETISGVTEGLKALELDLAAYRVRLLGKYVPFASKKGYLGWGPPGMRTGDLVCILFGCDMPVILRKVGDHYLNIGTCFVLGIMDGQALSRLDDGAAETRQFRIV